MFDNWIYSKFLLFWIEKHWMKRRKNWAQHIEPEHSVNKTREQFCGNAPNSGNMGPMQVGLQKY